MHKETTSHLLNLCHLIQLSDMELQGNQQVDEMNGCGWFKPDHDYSNDEPLKLCIAVRSCILPCKIRLSPSRLVRFEANNAAGLAGQQKE